MNKNARKKVNEQHLKLSNVVGVVNPVGGYLLPLLCTTWDQLNEDEQQQRQQRQQRQQQQQQGQQQGQQQQQQQQH